MAKSPGLHVDQRFPNPGMVPPSAQPGDYDPPPEAAPPARTPPPALGGGVETLPFDAIGDIPPPPIPAPPQTVGSGVAGGRGTEAGTFSRPGTSGAIPFRSAAFQPTRPRFGPGVPLAGGGSTEVSGLGADPNDIGELLRRLAAASGGAQ